MITRINRRWSGMITTNNVDGVVAVMREIMVGETYTFVAANELFRFKPEVRTDQELKTNLNGFEIEAYHSEKTKSAGFHAHDTYGVWGCSTNLTEDVFDVEYNNPHIDFEYNKITITHRAPAGHKLYWVIAVQEGE